MSFRERPEHFTLDYSSPLARGLVFAGLGNSPGSVRYKDSSSRRNDGTLTDMVPAEDWVWINELGRWGIDIDSFLDVVTLTAGLPGSSAAISLSAWVQKKTVGTTGFLISSSTPSSSGWDWGLYQSSSTQKWAWYTRTSGTASSQEAVASANGWHHVAGVYDGSYTRLYVDGTQVDFDALTGTVVDNGYTTRMGGVWAGAANQPQFGASDVLLYSRALSPSEIQQLAGPSNFMLSGLVLPPRRTIWNIGWPTPAAAVTNKVYITAGLPVAKDGETPSGNTVYITAGLPPEPAAGGANEAEAVSSLGAFGHAAAGAVSVAGDISSTLGAFGQAAAGEVAGAAEASAVSTLGAFRQAAASSATVQLAGVSTLAGMGQVATGEVVVTGAATAASTLGAFGQRAVGACIVEGAATSTLGAFAQAASATPVVPGAATSTLGSFGQAASAEHVRKSDTVSDFGAFGQVASAGVASACSATSTLGGFGQVLAVRHLSSLNAISSLPAFGQAASGEVGANQAAVVSSLGAFSQEAVGVYVTDFSPSWALGVNTYIGM